MHWFVKLAAAIGAVVPLASAVGMGCYMAYRIIVHDMETGGLTRPPGGVPPNPFDATDWIVFAVILVLIVFVQLATSIGFAIHASRDPRLGNGGKVLWIVGFFGLGAFALPLYFAVFMLRDPPPARIADLQSPPTKE